MKKLKLCKLRTIQKYESILLRPNSTFKQKWDLLIILFAIFNCFQVPMDVAFEPEVLQTIGFKVLNYMVDTIFLIDILIVFRTTFINEKGQEVTESYDIALNYLKSTFIVDLMATIPFDDILQAA